MLEFTERNIRSYYNSTPYFQKLSEVHPSDIRGRSKIFINGSWIGITDQPETIMKGLLSQRRRATISKEISIVNNFVNKEFKEFRH